MSLTRVDGERVEIPLQLGAAVGFADGHLFEPALP